MVYNHVSVCRWYTQVRQRETCWNVADDAILGGYSINRDKFVERRAAFNALTEASNNKRM